MGTHGLGRFLRENHGWAGLKLDNPWADFFRPGPAQPIRTPGTEEGEEERQKKDKEKSLTKVDIEVSWCIAGLKTDQLNAFRVNSKRDTLE